MCPMKRHLYPPNWRQISLSIRERAGNRCETCGAPNGQLIARGCDQHAGTYMVEDGHVFDAETGEERGMCRGSEYDFSRFVRIVLTVAHLDQNPANNDPANLKALCQMHHLRLDQAQHVRNARETRDRKRGQSQLTFATPVQKT